MARVFADFVRCESAQPHRPPLSGGESCEQFARGGAQFVRVVGRRGEFPGVGVGRKVAEANLDRDRLRIQTLGAQPPPNFVGLAEQLRLDRLHTDDVLGESLFLANRLRRTIDLDFAVVDAVTQSMPTSSAITEIANELPFACKLQVAESCVATRAQLLGGNRADAPHALDRKRRESSGKRWFAAFVELVQLDKRVRLAQITGDLGAELVVSHADRASQLKLRAHRSANRLADRAARAEQSERRSDIDEGFVEAERLDVGRVAAENLMNCPRNCGVRFEARRGHHRLRTKPHGLTHRHGAATAKLSCFVTGGTNNASPLKTSDQHWLSAQRRIVALLDRCVERVHINMENDATRRRLLPIERHLAEPASVSQKNRLCGSGFFLMSASSAD